MVSIKPLDPLFTIQQQLEEAASPVVLINIFTVNQPDIEAFLNAWEHDANWMKRQPGYISTQLHKAIGESSLFLNYAVWESVSHFKQAFIHPEFKSAIGAYPSNTVGQPHLFSKIAVKNLCTI